jgi:hypothetical protein
LGKGLKEMGDLTLRQQILALGLTLSKINDWVIERLPVSLTTPTHLINQGMLFGKGMECSITKAPLEGPFCCCFVHPHHSSSNRDCSVDPP